MAVGESVKVGSHALPEPVMPLPAASLVHQHGLRQAVTPKDVGEAVLDRVSLLVGTGPQRQVEARVIVQEGERMAAVVLHGNVSLEVHLPQLVGFGTLKAHIGCVLGSLGFIDEPMSSENGSDRALGRHARIAAIATIVLWQFRLGQRLPPQQCWRDR